MLLRMSPEAVSAPRPIVLDADHLLRWADTREEARFFGVNYLAPFSYTNRAIGYVKATPEETIRQDLTHLQRMGLNAVRLHVWDNEISDHEGNLVVNEHLRLLDYLIAECRQRGLYVFLTPIAWLGNGYPEADLPLSGFSSHSRKGEMGTNPATITAEARYLDQFVRHINLYTQIAYKDDPAIMGFEFVNEPWSPPADRLTGYVDTLAAAIRGTGCQKPLFYCASQSGYRQHSDALQTAQVDGVTFGWYPSGLVARRTLKQNVLPLLDQYPLMTDAAFARKVKAVYEFDAADIDASCLYPAFARTFRQNGIQWATQFAYCPLPLADSNTPYPTHYLNLIYTPNKAVSMSIAAEAFRSLPIGKSFGRYPENTTFGPFTVDYAADRSEMRTDTAFLYSRDTDHAPPNPRSLTRIVGCGSSPVVRYEGTGSYFLEKQQAGVWRLEVYPDVVRVQDPHGSPRLDREAVILLHQKWPMQIALPDLGDDFQIRQIDTGNQKTAYARAGRLTIRPGVFLLVKRGITSVVVTPSTAVIPPAQPRLAPIIVHTPFLEAVAGKPFVVTATVAAAPLPRTVTLQYRTTTNAPFRTVALKRIRGYRYAATLPGANMTGATLEYSLSAGPATEARPAPDTVLFRARSIGADQRTLTVTLPRKSGVSAHFSVPLTPSWHDYSVPFTDLRPDKGYIVLHGPTDKDLGNAQYSVSGDVATGTGFEVETLRVGTLPQHWSIPIVPSDHPIPLMQAERDAKETLIAAKYGADGRWALTNGKEPGTQALSLTSTRFGKSSDLSVRWLLNQRWENLRATFVAKRTLQVRARASSPDTDRLTIALLDHDGIAWGTTISLSPEWRDIAIPLASLHSISIARVPAGYPSSVVNALSVPQIAGATLDVSRIEAVQLSLTGDLYGEKADGLKGIEIESIQLTEAQ